MVQSVIPRIARWSAQHPWRTVALWLAFVVAAFVIGGGVGTRTASGIDTAVGEAGDAARMVDEADLSDPAVENVLVTTASGQLDGEAAMAAARDAAGRLGALAEVESVGEPIASRDGSAVLVQATMGGDVITAFQRVDPLIDEVAEVDEAYPDLRVETVGDGTILKDFGERQGEDLSMATMLSVPVTLGIMLVAFGAIVAAGVPVLLALSTVMASMGLWALASQVVPDPGPVLHLIVLMGMAVGVDYSLFYVKREREERARGNGTVDAVTLAAATSGRAVVVAGLGTIVAMTALYLAGDATFSAMATGAILVVAVTVLGSMTILPAMLAKFGRRLDRPRVPLAWRLTNRAGEPRLWPVLLRPAVRHPLLTLLTTLLVLGGLAIPAMDMQLKTTAIDDLPRTLPTMQSYDRLIEAFPSEGNVHLVAVRAPAERSQEVQQAMAGLATRVGDDPLFAADQDPQVRSSADQRVHVVELATPYASDSQEARDSLANLREQHVPATIGTLDGVDYLVGGGVAIDVDYTDTLRTRLPWVIGAALLLIFGIMLIAFRSVPVAIVTVLLNALSAVAAFGLLAWVFQNEWAEGVLGFESTGHIVAWVPSLLFVILLGLSMDYHVYMVSRVRELTLAGMPAREAVPAGITRTAGVITSAATVMVLVFSLFALMSFIEFKQLGIGLMAAILIDATIIRAMALPACMTLLGRSAWWPSRLSRQDPRPPSQLPEQADQAAPASAPAMP